MDPEQSFEEALAGLREQYVAGCAERFDRIESLLEELSAGPSNRRALRDLMIQFHGFAGSGSTYGFPRVTTLGFEGERLCEALLKANAPVEERDMARCRDLLESLKSEVLEGAAEAGPTRDVEVRMPPFDILVVDPQAEARLAIERLALAEGMSVRAAATRAEALEKLSQRMPDGAIVEARLPDGPGSGLVEEIRSFPEGERLAILMLGEPSGFINRVDAIHCGADGYFDKPLEGKALLRRLTNLLERGRTDPPRVLSVEDDADQAAYIRAVLESAGYSVRTCREPRHLAADLSTFRPDLVLLDIELPEADGFALARYIRQQEAYAALPVLFLTTRGHLDSQIESMRAGGDDYLVKPVAPGLLLSAVASRIERARFVRSLLERDGLTRLLTHTAFLERGREIAEGRRQGSTRPAALILMDLDGFKSLNDRYGHPAGDGVLCSLASLLRRRLRQSDVLGRLGGDEFAAIVENIGEKQAVRLMERIREEFGTIEQASAGEPRFYATFSAGVAVLEPGQDINRWRERADSALYDAKSEGRNRVAAGGG
ncbi:MAG TPA: diguanylate cyclase [Thermoanaerobaculia bacterium]|nr:diguanylate cyclase [Thermoanaerobaculia bacterium]